MGLISIDDAVATLEQAHAVVSDLFARIDDAQAQQPRTIGGGEWSAKDLMGHLAFWEELAIDAIEAWRDGRLPRAEQVFTGDHVDAINAENFERTAASSMDEVRARAARAHDTLVAMIREIPDDLWRAKPAYETTRRRTLAEMLGSVLGAPKKPFGHATAHEADLRAAVEAFSSTR